MIFCKIIVIIIKVFVNKLLCWVIIIEEFKIKSVVIESIIGNCVNKI